MPRTTLRARLPRRAPLLATLAILALSIPASVRATPYWTQADYDAWLRGAGESPAPAFAAPVPREGQSHIDYLAQLTSAAAFVASFQVTTPGINFGGIREGEHLQNIIQTDNTSESIWLWTRYWQETGDTTYNQNIRNSFTYSRNFPAYNEEGSNLPSTGYYRMYNCGWAAFAEWYYRTATGDTTQKVYGDSCADYIATHNLNRNGPAFDQAVNPHVLAWAAGNLWIVANAQGNAVWRAAAADRGLRAKGWVEGEGTLLSSEMWAMSGGATMWGILHSWFAEFPESTAIWTGARKDSMDSYSSPPGAFTTAWNGWYARGHNAVWEALLYDPARLRALALVDTMASEDGDADGGIEARPEDADTMDQTWVTSYLAAALDPWIVRVAVPAGASPEPIHLLAAPNPSLSDVTVRFALTHPGLARVEVFDLTGRRVRRLLDEALAAREHRVVWDGRDDAGETVAAGAYVLRLVTPDGAGSLKAVRLR